MEEAKVSVNFRLPLVIISFFSSLKSKLCIIVLPLYEEMGHAPFILGALLLFTLFKKALRAIVLFFTSLE